jgi:hypothetical protein
MKILRSIIAMTVSVELWFLLNDAHLFPENEAASSWRYFTLIIGWFPAMMVAGVLSALRPSLPSMMPHEVSTGQRC